MTEPLDPLALPLRGSRLIEASAGTGKTWTIAALYLRLVLGHAPCIRAGDRPLLPSEILVMTFTRAATRELSDRIRKRLAGAAAVFRGLAPAPEDDEFLVRVLAAYPPGPLRETAAWRLDSAAEAMDDAAVLTIDAWCQRTLREHAPDRGIARDDAVQPDTIEVKTEAAQDYWRQEVYALDGAALAVALRSWGSPGGLALLLRDVDEKPLPADAGEGSLAARIGGWLARLATAKQPWHALLDPMQAWLEVNASGEGAPLSANKLRSWRGWIEALREWAADPVEHELPLKETARSRLTPAGLRDACRKGRAVEIPACFETYEALLDALDAVPAAAPLLNAHAAAHVEARLQQLKAQRQMRSHHDVQVQLAEALDPARGGERAQMLRDRVRRRFPAALVDEFQDTSPLQLAILDHLYRIADDDPATALLLIGDPKQSIYAFRGADIHSYLRARRATEGRHHALAVNYRSTHALVDTVNTLFARAEARDGEGAFRFGPSPAAGGAAGNPVPFEPVRARGLDAALVADGAALPAMSLCVMPSPLNVSEARAWFAARCAQRIVDLLNGPQTGFRGADGYPWRPLAPGDIAVLVRNRDEAAAMQREFGRRSLPSVFLSDRDSVFATAEAADLVRVLRAIEDPGDVQLVRAALATGLIGLELPELVALADDEERFDAHAEQLRALRVAWQQRGVLAMLRELLHAGALPSRWLAQRDGERRLTDVLHLAELLQQAEAGVDGEAALLRWLEREVEGGGDVGVDEQVLRLESDADRVQIVTVHKSKGLQYALVFVPFATHVRDGSRARRWALWLPGDDGERRLVIDPRPADLARAELEARREDLRLLYVALTRAEHHLWIGVSLHRIGNARLPAWPRSAFGTLVSGTQDDDPARVLDALRALAAASAGVALGVVGEDEAASPGGVRALRVASREVPPPPAPPYRASFDRSWGIGSYSALVRDAGRPEEPAGAAEPDGLVTWSRLREDEALAESAAQGAAGQALQVEVRGDAAPWHRFARGALAGNFLHRTLEWLADEGFSNVATPAVQRALAQRCEREGFGARAADVQRWLERICTSALPPLGTALAQLGGGLAEMEFWLPGDGLDAQRLDALCLAHLWPDQPRPALAPRGLRGLLMGFADLVFEHEGRFWVLDYKSNALGAADADYDATAMQRAMLAHRYDVQAVLYLLPLHRLLRARLGAAYRPGEQLGGALYLFLRGIAGPSAGCCAVAPPLALLDELDRTLPAGTGWLDGDAA